MRYFSPSQNNKSHEDGKYFVNNFSHLPVIVQREVFYHLTILEFEDVIKRTDIDMKAVRDQYLKLAQKYHPDAISD